MRFQEGISHCTPCAAGARHRPGGPVVQDPLSPGAAAAGRPWQHRRMRVLVVEDEASIADALAIGLAAEGFDVDIADNGTDGLWRARETAYAAIILDILLPGMNGFKVCRTLRDEGVWTPILMLTAKDGELDEAEALDTGADDFLSQAVLVRGARGPAAALLRRGSHPPPDGAHRSAASRSTRRRGSAGGATPRSTSPPGSTRCSSC